LGFREYPLNHVRALDTAGEFISADVPTLLAV
jgi:hypothetical protein